MRTVLSALALATLLATAPTAQAQFSFMPYLGYQGQVEGPVIGVGARVGFPLPTPGITLALQPAVEVTLSNGTNLQVDVNAISEFAATPTVSPYVGGGLAIVIPDDDGVGTTDTNLGANVLGGLSFNAGFIQPFAQARYTFADDSYFSAHAGIMMDL